MQRHEGVTSTERTEVESCHAKTCSKETQVERELRWRVVMQRHEGDTSIERTEVERCHAKT